MYLHLLFTDCYSEKDLYKPIYPILFLLFFCEKQVLSTKGTLWIISQLHRVNCYIRNISRSSNEKISSHVFYDHIGYFNYVAVAWWLYFQFYVLFYYSNNRINTEAAKKLALSLAKNSSLETFLVRILHIFLLEQAYLK